MNRLVGLPVLLLSASLLALTPTALAHGDDDHADPGVSPSFGLFPTPDEVVADLSSYEGHPWVTLHELGVSTEGRRILLAEVSNPQSAVPLDERVVTFIFTQQHGNEPAGTPAALQILADITAKKAIADTFDGQILLLLPMANPDGAAANTRANDQGLDVNRDHIALESPEANILHAVLNRWDVHVAMDHHEYGGTGFGNPVPVRLYDYDLTTLYPNHGNVRAPTSDASRKLMYEGIWPAAEAAGFTANEYGEQTVAGVPVQQVAGGPDPGIMRNHIGLHHIAGLLVETRVDDHPNPFHDAARRAAVHSTVMEATLSYVHENAAMFRNAKAESLAAEIETPAANYVEGDVTAAIPGAFKVAAAQNTSALFLKHAMPAAVSVDAFVVHNMDHALRGHAAAVLHPSSTRAVAVAEATDAVGLPGVPGAAGEAVETAGPALAALLLLAFVVGASLRRRP